MGQNVHSGRGPSSVEPLAAGASFSSEYFQTLEFGKLTGICYQEGVSNAASGTLVITAINTDEQFALTSSISDIFVYSASAAPLPVDSATVFFFETSSDGNFASGSLKITVVVTDSQYSLTSSIADLFVYSASDAPLPSDSATVFFFETSSDGGSAADSLTGSILNLVNKINQTTGSFVVSASVSASDDGISLISNFQGTDGNSIQFQSASLGANRVTLAGGTANSLTESIQNLADKINQSTGSFFVSASVSAGDDGIALSASVPGIVGNSIEFQSSSATVTLEGGTAPAVSTGELQIQQSSTTSALAEVSGNIIPIANAEGVEFSVDFTGELVRVTYAQTGSNNQGIFRLHTYLRPF